VVSITNERGEETRHVVGVGAIQPGEERKFTVAVEVFAPSIMADAREVEDVALS
jgi:hypothetical protein